MTVYASNFVIFTSVSIFVCGRLFRGRKREGEKEKEDIHKILSAHRGALALARRLAVHIFLYACHCARVGGPA